MKYKELFKTTSAVCVRDRRFVHRLELVWTEKYRSEYTGDLWTLTGDLRWWNENVSVRLEIQRF